MGVVSIAIGLALLALTAREFVAGESDTFHLFDLFDLDWLSKNVNRQEHPVRFHAALIALFCSALGLIGSGIAAL